jgi:hypothetical protein
MKNECEPMFLSWFIALGPFLLLAAKKPSSHRSLIAFAACQSLAHASVMTILTVQAWKDGVHEISRMLSSSASSGEFCWHSRPRDNSRAGPLPRNILKHFIYYYADRFGPLPTEVMAKVRAAPAGLLCGAN